MSTPTSGRLSRTRASIAATAISLFEETSFEAITVDQIADTMGISRRTIFRHFESKADIVMEPILVGFRALPDSLHAQPRDRPVGEAIIGCLETLVNVLEGQRHVIARHVRIVEQSETLRALSRSLNETGLADLRSELAARLGDPDSHSIHVSMWAEAMFSIVFGVGARDRWLLQPDQPIAPVITESLGALHAFTQKVISRAEQGSGAAPLVRRLVL